MPPHTMMDHNTNLVRSEGQPMMVSANGSSSEGQQGARTRVKCVLVGDGAVGKTSLIVSYTTNGFPNEYLPTAFDNYSVEVTVDNKPVQLQLCDTAGQDDFDTLRPLCYPHSHVFLLCFSVMSPTSFHNVLEKWVPELRKHCPGAPLVLVGTQSDLRNNVNVLIELNRYGDQPVSEEEACRLAGQLGAQYVECSSLTQKNLKEVFDTGILASLRWSDPPGGRGGEEEVEAGGLLGRSKSLLRKSKRSKLGKDNGAAVFVPSAAGGAAAGGGGGDGGGVSSGKGSCSNKKAAWKKLCCFMG